MTVKTKINGKNNERKERDMDVDGDYDNDILTMDTDQRETKASGDCRSIMTNAERLRRRT